MPRDRRKHDEHHGQLQRQMLKGLNLRLTDLTALVKHAADRLGIITKAQKPRAHRRRAGKKR